MVIVIIILIVYISIIHKSKPWLTDSYTPSQNLSYKAEIRKEYSFIDIDADKERIFQNLILENTLCKLLLGNTGAFNNIKQEIFRIKINFNKSFSSVLF